MAHGFFRSQRFFSVGSNRTAKVRRVPLTVLIAERVAGEFSESAIPRQCPAETATANHLAVDQFKEREPAFPQPSTRGGLLRRDLERLIVRVRGYTHGRQIIRRS